MWVRPMTTATMTIPLRLPSTANARQHWAARARTVKAQRATIALYWRAPPGDAVRELARRGPPWAVEIIRTTPARPLDDDNLAGACKAVRDEVARLLGVDDGPTAPVAWRYGQRKAPDYGVVVTLTRLADGAKTHTQWGENEQKP